MTTNSLDTENKIVYINTKVAGEPAEILKRLKERHIVQDNTDAICQGLFALWEHVMQRDALQRDLELKQRELELKDQIAGR